MNITATFDPKKYRKRGLPESVRKLENQIGSKFAEPYNKLIEPFAELKNSTTRGLNATEKIFKALYKDEDFEKYLQEHPRDTTDHSTSQGFELKGKLLKILFKDEDVRHFLENLPDPAFHQHNSTQCSPSNPYNQTLASTRLRRHSRKIRRSDPDPANCQHNNGYKKAAGAFSKTENRYWFEVGTNPGYESISKKELPDGWVTEEEEERMVAQMIAELQEQLKNPKSKWYIPPDKAVH